VAGIAARVQVMYGGTVVESGPVEDIFGEPRMPYTVGLLGSVPHPDLLGRPLTPIHGSPPSLLALPPGCSFGPRCPLVEPECRAAEPALVPAPTPRHTARCRRWPTVSELEQPQQLFLRPEMHHLDADVAPVPVPGAEAER
jgi:peptide/nickel transport system ATP-binding protein